MHQLELPNDLLFEGFLLRPQGLLRLDGTGNAESVALGSRALDLLRLLVGRRGEVVSKETILSTVWPGAIVEESNLTVQIANLRRVLDRNDGQESKIQTIRGRGYRFTAVVSRGDTTTDRRSRWRQRARQSCILGAGRTTPK